MTSASSSSSARENLRSRPSGWPVLHMRWEKLLFLHWRWDAAEIQARLPVGLQVDTFRGEAWLGIVPFFMRRVRPIGLPAVPWLSNFLELNVRTYVVDGHGRPGVWFFSLACNQPVAVELARRTFGLNYVHAKMEVRSDEKGWLRYECARRRASPAVLEYQPTNLGRPAELDSLEHFLVERYILYSLSPTGRLFSGQIHHTRYEFLPAEVRLADFAAARADGFSDPQRPADHGLVARDLRVEAWPIRPVD